MIYLEVDTADHFHFYVEDNDLNYISSIEIKNKNKNMYCILNRHKLYYSFIHKIRGVTSYYFQKIFSIVIRIFNDF